MPKSFKVEEAELWIVKLIQNAKLDARIDSEKGPALMMNTDVSLNYIPHKMKIRYVLKVGFVFNK